MPAVGLDAYLDRNPTPWPEPGCELFKVYNEHYSPGFWIAMVAMARAAGLNTESISFSNTQLKGYASAIGIDIALGQADQYPFERHNEGKNYSGLVLLQSAEATDRATACINGCIRSLIIDAALQPFVSNLCEVVGDLHDNVWSHGQSTGFSMAQKWKKPRSNAHYLEFALADCGIGFLRELQRVGLKIEGHRDAIEWCLEKGHSSKLVKPSDEWAQRLPPDVMGNPMGKAGRVFDGENHHLGLGLWKLNELVQSYSGELWLATGNELLYIGSNSRTFRTAQVNWQGVVLACRFDTEMLRRGKPTDTDSVTEDIAEFIGGHSGNQNL